MKKNYLLFVMFIIGLVSSCQNSLSEIEPKDSQRLELNWDQGSFENLSDYKFDLSLYNKRDSIFNAFKANIEPTLIPNDISSYSNALNLINNQYNSNLSVTPFDNYIFQNPNSTLEDYYNNGFISEFDFNLLGSFFDDLLRYDFNKSMDLLQTRINNGNYTNDEFNKANYLLNNLGIINDYYAQQGINIFSVENICGTPTPDGRMNGWKAAGCAVALAANAGSTYGLLSCFVPNPACGFAISMKVLSFAGVFLGCL